MIDASRSPRPAWKRFTTIAVVAGLILLALLMIWKKELHHSSASGAAPAPPAVTTPARSAKPAPTPAAVSGGIPISNRDPFQG